jgi:hypothetical protein
MKSALLEDIGKRRVYTGFPPGGARVPESDTLAMARGV